MAVSCQQIQNFSSISSRLSLQILNEGEVYTVISCDVDEMKGVISQGVQGEYQNWSQSLGYYVLYVWF